MHNDSDDSGTSSDGDDSKEIPHENFLSENEESEESKDKYKNKSGKRQLLKKY